MERVPSRTRPRRRPTFDARKLAVPPLPQPQTSRGAGSVRPQRSAAARPLRRRHRAILPLQDFQSYKIYGTPCTPRTSVTILLKFQRRQTDTLLESTTGCSRVITGAPTGRYWHRYRHRYRCRYITMYMSMSCIDWSSAPPRDHGETPPRRAPTERSPSFPIAPRPFHANRFRGGWGAVERESGRCSSCRFGSSQSSAL